MARAQGESDSGKTRGRRSVEELKEIELMRRYRLTNAVLVSCFLTVTEKSEADIAHHAGNLRRRRCDRGPQARSVRPHHRESVSSVLALLQNVGSPPECELILSDLFSSYLARPTLTGLYVHTTCRTSRRRASSTSALRPSRKGRSSLSAIAQREAGTPDVLRSTTATSSS